MERYNTYRFDQFKYIISYKYFKGALIKNLLVRNDYVQVLYGFDSVENAYLTSEMFNNDVAKDLSPL